jgi:hypothetical protein
MSQPIERTFEDIRPYYDSEVNAAVHRIVAEPTFELMLQFLFPDQPHQPIIDNLKNAHSAEAFQRQFMHPAVYAILDKTSAGLTCSGFDALPKNEGFLFISNHRDIVLDAAILQVLLYDHGLDSSEISFGDNLMYNQFVIDMGKVNKMYTVFRSGNIKEFYRNSLLLSSYLRNSLTVEKHSAWIAQRNGRTKNGDDRTEIALLKMLNMSGNKSIARNLRELNIVPMTVSYEFEPCCRSKVFELYSRAKTGGYTKQPGEDLMSILNGFRQYKGGVHIAVDSILQIDNEIDGLAGNDAFGNIAGTIDRSVYKHYKLWPNNYIAHDLYYENEEYRSKYTTNQKGVFLQYMEKELQGLDGDRNELEKILLLIYANALTNAIK